MGNKGIWTAVALAVLACIGSPPAAADYAKGMDALATKDHARARAEFEAVPEDPQAVYQLARMARLGLGEPRNDSRRAHLLERAAELGHSRAKLEWALALANGIGIPADPPRGLKLLEELDGAGFADATVYLARAWRHGWFGMAKDEVRSAALLRKAADGGNDTANALYAIALLQGVGVEADAARGIALLKATADKGNLEAQLEYARLLTYGLLGVGKDEAAGIKLYRSAAEHADPLAQYALCLAYVNGRGVARDDAAAARWCDAAARQGDAYAQLRLGEMFRTGVGVPRLRGSAYFWYTLAARSTSGAGEIARDRRAILAREMSAAEIDNQVKRAAAFEPQPGFRPRAEPLPPLARGDRVTLGSVSVLIPAPAGYQNHWEFVETLQRATPNDPELAPRLMVLIQQDDMSRIKLGLPGPLRAVEIARHLPDDTAVTPALFADIRQQFRDATAAAQAAGRVGIETLRDDEAVFAIVRTSLTGQDRADGFALMAVGGRVLTLTFTGFQRDHLAELRTLVGSATSELLARNAAGPGTVIGGSAN